MRRFAFIAICLAAITSCTREKQEPRPAPAGVAVYGDAAAESSLHPGGAQPSSASANPYHGQANAIAEGQRLFGWYNCSGCHANGGGGIGPPLIKKDWVYGGEPANIFATIVRGRPNGMPTWGARIPEYQIWQIVAYVRSLNNQEPTSATPVRGDNIQKEPTIENKVQGTTK